jgi:prepilin-type N-terminal cleavage/methylation domain-containing protein
MTRPRCTRTANPDGESGFTLVEMAVAMLVLGIVMSIFFSILASVQRSMVRETSRSATMDQARLAIEGIDRDVRSGSVLCETTTGTTPPPYYTVSIYTRNAYTGSATTYGWVQYRVLSQTLQRRERTGASWQAWRTVAEGIVNSGSTDAPFRLSTSSAMGAGSTLGSRVLDVTMIVNTKPSDATASNVRLESSMTIRNQSNAGTCPAPA